MDQLPGLDFLPVVGRQALVAPVLFSNFLNNDVDMPCIAKMTLRVNTEWATKLPEHVMHYVNTKYPSLTMVVI